MSHLRFDRFTERWIVIAPGRRGIGATRPAGAPTPELRCPFCPGHESDTEATLFSIGEPWRVRVVGNRYPLVEPKAATPSVSRARAATGHHEVIVESAEHEGDLATAAPDVAFEILLAYRERVRALEALAEVASVQLFRNKGRRAGSSQPHPHAQIVALPVVPRQLATRFAIAERFRATGTRLLDDVIREEREAFVRVVADADDVVTFVPFATERAFHTVVASTSRARRFAEASDAELRHLGPRLADAARRAITAAGTTDYNVVLRDAAPGADHGFYFDILPRTGGDAGFELATDMPVSTVTPEEAASELRAV